jgi:hypothetical protein
MNKSFIRLFFFCTLTFCLSAHAMDFYRFGNRLLEVGDPVVKLIELAGEPAYKEPIEDHSGAFEGERWQYNLDGMIVTFVIRDAKVRSIQQARP